VVALGREQRSLLLLLREGGVRNIHGSFREHAGDIQGTCREHSGHIQFEWRWTPTSPRPQQQEALQENTAGDTEYSLSTLVPKTRVNMIKRRLPGGDHRIHHVLPRGPHNASIIIIINQENIQGTFRETFREHSGKSQGTFREHSGNIQGTFQEHSGNIQGTFRVHSGNI
jgi:hypothetical protein